VSGNRPITAAATISAGTAPRCRVGGGLRQVQAVVASTLSRVRAARETPPHTTQKPLHAARRLRDRASARFARCGRPFSSSRFQELGHRAWLHMRMSLNWPVACAYSTLPFALSTPALAHLGHRYAILCGDVEVRVLVADPHMHSTKFFSATRRWVLGEVNIQHWQSPHQSPPKSRITRFRSSFAWPTRGNVGRRIGVSE